MCFCVLLCVSVSLCVFVNMDVGGLQDIMSYTLNNIRFILMKIS